MGLRILKDFKEEKHIVQRERTPIDIILYAVFLYLGGLSLKGVKTRLIGITRSRTAIWKWVQKFGNAVKGKLADNLPSVIIADETTVSSERLCIYGFGMLLIQKTRKIVHWKITWNRTNTVCKKFFQEIEQIYGKKADLVVTDGGPWYKILPRIGWSHETISGGIRSYVERMIETVKDRTRLFDNYFPSKHTWVAGHVKRWMDLFLFYYNWIRSHMTFQNNSPILAKRGIVIVSEYERFLYVLREVVLC